MRTSHLTSTLLALALLAPRAGAEAAHLVRDLSQSPGPDIGSDPSELAGVANRVVFSARAPDPSFRRLWASDGTAAGTRLLSPSLEDAVLVREFQDRLLYLGQGPQGLGLWATRGTPETTRRLTPPGVNPSLEALASSSGRLWFFQRDAAGSTLWGSDGTPQGTRAVVSLGARETLHLTAAGDRLYFFASEGLNTPACGPIPTHCEQDDPLEWKLWVSDGTPRGTRPLRSFGVHLGILLPVFDAAGADRAFFFTFTPENAPTVIWASRGTRATTEAVASFPTQAVRLTRPTPQDAGRPFVFFADAGQGTELWLSDGTRAGTHAATAFADGLALRDSGIVVHQGGETYFAATKPELGTELWVTSGTPATTHLVADLCPGACSGLSAFWITPLGDSFLFPASDAAGASQLWRLAAGELAPLFAAGDEPYHSASGVRAVIRGRAYFEARDEESSTNLWRTDGTAEGTSRLTYFGSNGVGGFFSTFYVVPLRNSVAFTFTEEAHGDELWLADGRPEGTRLVTDLRVGNGASSDPVGLTAFGETTLFFACIDREVKLFKSRGDAATTEPLATLVEDCQSFYGHLFEREPLFTVNAGRAYFHNGKNLWVTDGTAAGTRALTSFMPDDFTVVIGEVAPFGSGVIFVLFRYDVEAQVNHAELWRSDGTPAGTAFSFAPPELNGIFRLAALGDRLFFTGYERNPPNAETDTFEIWVTDGTAAGTVKLTNRRNSSLPSFPGSHFFTELNGFTYFVVDNKLWRTDGTAAGTEDVSSAVVPGCGSGALGLRTWNGALYYIAELGTSGDPALCRTDGTAAGTERLTRLPGTFFVALSPLVEFDGRLFLLTGTSSSGFQLWATDGTAAGTQMVGDLSAFGTGSRDLVAAGGRLYFQLGEPASGFELWSSDGTAAGTERVQDIAPGPASSSPTRLTAVGSRLDFSADDGLTGVELWSLPLAGSGLCESADQTLCLAGGRFRLEAVYRARDGRSGGAVAAPLTALTGGFSFFNPANPDLFVKVLEGGPGPADDRVFAGSLSSADFELTVTRMDTGGTERFHNLLGNFASFAATAPKAAASGPCTPGPDHLCLLGGRFRVELAWTQNGSTNAAMSLAAGDGAGYFWFFRPANLEAAVKMIDGRTVNGHFWAFVAGLTNLETRLTITDTTTGVVKTYTKPQGAFSSFADTAAF